MRPVLACADQKDPLPLKEGQRNAGGADLYVCKIRPHREIEATDGFQRSAKMRLESQFDTVVAAAVSFSHEDKPA